MNAGFLEAHKLGFHFDCVIFHDVDVLPEDDRNLYSCPATTVRHLASAVDAFNYT